MVYCPQVCFLHLAEWLHRYALPLEILLVILSALVALYADTVRHFLSLPPQKLSTWILKAKLLSVNAKLFNLCECQNNAFTTLLYITRTFVAGAGSDEPFSGRSVSGGGGSALGGPWRRRFL